MPIHTKGLTNLGNSCFLNAVLQSLTSCPSFVSGLKDSSNAKGVKSKSFSASLLFCLQNLRTDDKSKATEYSPRSIVEYLSKDNPNLNGSTQQDALEALQAILNALEKEDQTVAEEMKSSSTSFTAVLDENKNGQNRRSGDHKIVKVSPLFDGWQATERYCLTCKNSTPSKHEIFNSILLSIPPPQNRSTRAFGMKGNKSLGCIPSFSQGMASNSSETKFGASHMTNDVSIFSCLDDYFRSECITDVYCSLCSINQVVDALGAKLNQLREKQATSTTPNKSFYESREAHTRSTLRVMDALHVTGQRDAVVVDIHDDDEDFTEIPLACLHSVALGGETMPAISREAASRPLSPLSTYYSDHDSSETYSEQYTMIGMLKQKVNTTAMKIVAISRLPRLLCLNLGRGDYNYLLGNTQKVAQHVRFPVQLNMGRYMSSHRVHKRSNVLNKKPTTSTTVVTTATTAATTYAADVSSDSDTDTYSSSTTCASSSTTSGENSPVNGVSVPLNYSGGSAEALGLDSRIAEHDRLRDSLSDIGVESTSRSVSASSSSRRVSASPSSSSSSSEEDSSIDFMYQLKAVVIHEGGGNRGHYCCYSFVDNGPTLSSDSGGRTPIQLARNGYWMHFSDTRGRRVSEREVLSSEAFLLFYEKVTSAAC